MGAEDIANLIKEINEVNNRQYIQQLNWPEIEKHLINRIDRQVSIKISFFYNCSFLGQYFSDKFFQWVYVESMKILEQQINYDFYQSRWIALNITLLSKLYSSNKLTPEQSQQLIDFAKEYALLIPDKYQNISRREVTQGNDFATITFHLKNLGITDMPEVYVYLENQLLNFCDSLNKVSLMLLIQSFGIGYIHSQTLFFWVTEKLYAKSNSLSDLKLHELAIFISCLSKFWVFQASSNFLDSIKERVREFIEVDQSNQIDYYIFQLLKIHNSIIQLPELSEEKEKLESLLLQIVDESVGMNRRCYLLFSLINNNKYEVAQKYFDKYIKNQLGFDPERDKQMTEQMKKLAIYDLRLIYYCISHFNVVHKNYTDLEYNTALLGAMKDLKPNQQIINISDFSARASEIIKAFVKQYNLEMIEELDVGLYFIDIYIPEKNIAVEVQGLQHFCWRQNIQNAKSMAKQRYLKALGFEVVYINVLDMASTRDYNLLDSMVQNAIKNHLESQ
ncbi:UNKNOWN [Stylonychia lemnae]|uniref:RAP domain-containing protein n=1 Tax=Stylonychia lemnae TaxID=5949 RepID=A0A078A9Q7_STYLE|nr:UNKNOWN [Stylonychia lemnae]|eukprot:CDW78621.1 UNKNOWN [Stylonychia lemnae]